MDRFIYIRNGEDDAYVNSADNFKGMTQTGSAAVEMLFDSAASTGAYDKIVLVVTANKEKEAMAAIGGALAGAKAGSTAVIADDYGAKYCDDVVTGVTSISVELKGDIEPAAITTAIDRTMLATESGSTVLVNHAAKVITLPTVALGLKAGMNFTVVPLIDPTAGWTVVAAEGIYGAIQVTSATQAEGLAAEQSVLRSACVAAPTSYDNFDLAAATASLGGVAGESFKFTYDGAAWLLGNTFISSDSDDPASIAIINAG